MRAHKSWKDRCRTDPPALPHASGCSVKQQMCSTQHSMHASCHAVIQSLGAGQNMHLLCCPFLEFSVGSNDPPRLQYRMAPFSGCTSALASRTKLGLPCGQQRQPQAMCMERGAGEAKWIATTAELRHAKGSIHRACFKQFLMRRFQCSSIVAACSHHCRQAAITSVPLSTPNSA